MVEDSADASLFRMWRILESAECGVHPHGIAEHQHAAFLVAGRHVRRIVAGLLGSPACRERRHETLAETAVCHAPAGNHLPHRRGKESEREHGISLDRQLVLDDVEP